MFLRHAVNPYRTTQCCNLQDHNINFHTHPNPRSNTEIANSFIVWRNGKTGDTQASFVRAPRAVDVYRYVTSARRMNSALNVSIAKSGHPEMLAM